MLRSMPRSRLRTTGPADIDDDDALRELLALNGG